MQLARCAGTATSSIRRSITWSALMSSALASYESSKLQIGDTVHIKYENAALIRATKVASDGIRERVDETATIPASGGSTATARRVQVLATVQKVDHAKRTITIRGPNKTETLQAGPDVSLKGIKVGDSVHAEFIEATAVLVTRNGAPIK
ncbi:MAG: hypothetical protein JWR14_1886 [Caballeronia sp.]|uniref:copper-binding protein n=1 Tax=Caballeronia sp. TaxID=1931223 RepID=UPI00261BD747|nr:copper-binding protein [Caballeronia sp.]MDB5832056.1 hypothetical protein [Caballeronia sp.]